MKRFCIPRTPGTRQRGASLLVVIMLIAAMGLATLTTFHLSRNQYRLVGNIQHLEQAFGNAEGVIAGGENWLETGANHRAAGLNLGETTLTPGLFPIGHLDQNSIDPKTMTWSDTNSVSFGEGRYLIERIAQGLAAPGESMGSGEPDGGAKKACRAVDVFRVIGRADARRGASRTIESTYATTGCSN